MKKELGTALAGLALAATVVGGVVAVDTAPSKSTVSKSYGSPVACITADCGTPVALPTVTAESTTVVDTIEVLPATGTGSSR